MNLLYLIILFPLLGFFLLAFSRGRWSENISAMIGVGSIGLAVLTTAWVALDFYSTGAQVFNQYLWTWISVEYFHITITLSLDRLSLTMLSVVTCVSFLIHLYSSWYMHGEEGYSRFFAYTNLFIASMVLLVLADNLLLMYLGWEGVGLCSYLLIGFYYTELKNCVAAMKAFIITRIGDVFLVIALFMLYEQVGTLNFHDLMILAPTKLSAGSTAIMWSTLMLLCGAVGKSAQFPLQGWLPDAMLGPTPVSALIHAATMVTSGVYLIARTHELFLLAPDVLYLVGIIGTLTLIFGGFSALVQTDIKRVLAYSTMSQIGYMFLGLGVQGWRAAIFHLITHAFFKALLFLASGSVILACQHEQNIFKIRNLRKSIPFLYICFVIGGAALSSLPLVSAGFYSKDEILWVAWGNGHITLMLVALLGSFLTSLYMFRMIFIIFHSEKKIEVYPDRDWRHYLPLFVLLLFSTFIGSWIKPSLPGVFPESNFDQDDKLLIEIFSGVVGIIAMCLAAILWLGKSRLVNMVAASVPGTIFSTWWFYAWGLDWVYDKVFVKPYLTVARILSRDPLNALMNTVSVMLFWLARKLTMIENGQLRWYAALMSLGAVIVVVLLVFI